MSVCGGGKAKKEEAKEEPETMESQITKELIKQYDNDKDKKINEEELKKLLPGLAKKFNLPSMDPDTLNASVKKIFGDHDKNQDGKLNVKELAGFLAPMMKALVEKKKADDKLLAEKKEYE